MFSVLQLNCRGLNVRRTELQNYIQTAHPTIICLQETLTTPGKKDIKFPNYDLIRNDRTDKGGGGIAIYSLDSVNTNAIQIDCPEDDEIEANAISVKLDNGTSITILNVYDPPRNHKPNRTALQQIYNQISDCPNLIVCGDFNARHSLWGNKTNKRGEDLYDFIEANNLVILNDGSTTFYGNSKKTSSVDLTPTTPNISLKCDWTPTDTLGSDHMALLTTIHLTAETTTLNVKPIWNLKKADWKAYELDTLLWDDTLISHKDVNTFTTSISSFIITSAEKFIPTFTPKPRPITIWNDDCTTATKTRRNALRRLQRHRTPENWTAYQTAHKNAQTIINETRQNNWINFFDTLNDFRDAKKTWRRISAIMGKSRTYTMPTLTTDAATATTPEEKTELLAQTYQAVSSNENLPDNFRMADTSASPSPLHQWPTEMDTSFSLAEFEDALRPKQDTAGGHDQIRYSMLKNLSTKAKLMVLELINKSWEDGEVPSEWKIANIIPILKPQKPKNSPSSYRPINYINNLQNSRNNDQQPTPTLPRKERHPTSHTEWLSAQPKHNRPD